MKGDEQIGRRIAELRKEKGMSQQELANAINSTQALIAKVETGARSPQIDMISRIADVLGTDCDYLIRGKKTEYLQIGRDIPLSSKAIDNLLYWLGKNNMIMHEFPETQSYTDAVEFFLENPTDGLNIIMLVYLYLIADFDTVYYVDWQKGIALDESQRTPTDSIKIALNEARWTENMKFTYGLRPDDIAAMMLMKVMDSVKKWRNRIKNNETEG